MKGTPHAELLRTPLQKDLSKNLQTVKTILNVPLNEDVVLRMYQCSGFELCAIYVEGMADDKKISEFILHACKESSAVTPISSGSRIESLSRDFIEIAQCSAESDLQKIISGILGGMTAVFIDGEEEALLLETRGFAHRPISKPLNESVVIGSQEGFVESLRSNITLVRRYLQSSQLITERLTIGSGIPTGVALMYLKGVVQEEIIDEARRRLKSIGSTSIQGIGSIQQHIEDSPLSLFPQMQQTERPDRVAAALTEGQFAILADTSPYALCAPVTLFHLIHAPDDTFMRWQYATFLRIIRIAGILLSLFLPGLYVAVTMHHSHLIPMNLLLSIAETRSSVPFSILSEVLLMEFAFYLINEAGTRIPSQIGSTISIVGGLILGQAAVSASIISPILIIIIALTGLGSYAVPSYSLGLSVVIYRICIVFSGALLGLYGILLAAVAMSVHLCGIHSFSIPYLAPIAPKRPHNPDIILRLPVRKQVRPMYYARKDSWLRNKERGAL